MIPSHRVHILWSGAVHLVHLAPVVQKLDSAIQLLNNWGLVSAKVECIKIPIYEYFKETSRFILGECRSVHKLLKVNLWSDLS